MSAYKYLTA
jgi:hypothetical protein